MGVADSSGARIPEPNGVTPVGLKRRTRVPTVGAVWGPRGAFGGLDVDQDSNARGRNGRAIEVDGAMELGMRRKFGVDARAAEEIECEFSLGQEPIPKVQGKVLVDTAQAGNKMVLERADGAFGGIASVQSWRHKLEVNGFVPEKLFERGGALIVQAVQLGPQASGDKAGVQDLERRENAWASAAAHCFD